MLSAWVLHIHVSPHGVLRHPLRSLKQNAAPAQKRFGLFDYALERKRAPVWLSRMFMSSANPRSHENVGTAD